MVQSRGACEKLDGTSHALNILRSWLDGGFDVWTVRATKRKTRELQQLLQRLALGGGVALADDDNAVDECRCLGEIRQDS